MAGGVAEEGSWKAVQGANGARTIHDYMKCAPGVTAISAASRAKWGSKISTNTACWCTHTPGRKHSEAIAAVEIPGASLSLRSLRAKFVKVHGHGLCKRAVDSHRCGSRGDRVELVEPLLQRCSFWRLGTAVRVYGISWQQKEVR